MSQPQIEKDLDNRHRRDTIKEIISVFQLNNLRQLLDEFYDLYQIATVNI